MDFEFIYVGYNSDSKEILRVVEKEPPSPRITIIEEVLNEEGLVIIVNTREKRVRLKDGRYALRDTT